MKARVYIKTYGCQMNERDSETLQASLESRGYELIDVEKDADIVILNTCSVREMAELKALGKAGILLRKKRKNPNFKLCVIGCMAQNRGKNLTKELQGVDLVAGPQSLSKVPELIDQLFEGNDNSILSTEEVPQLNEKFYEQLTEKPKVCTYLSIQNGCNMKCTYCIVPKTRGREKYRSISSIVREAESLAKKGTKEITLLGQIVNRYGTRTIDIRNGKTPFVQLLEAINEVDGIERIRFMSPHPIGFKKDLVEAFAKLPKLCPYVHLPLQSGSNKILKAMKRGYSKEKFLDLVKELKIAVPGIALSTDVIVGFPGETEEDFKETYGLFDQIGFDMAYIFKYSPRPDTVAAYDKEQLPEDEKEKRNQALLGLLQKHSLAKHKALIGSSQKVLLENYAPKKNGQIIGKTPHGKKVIVEAPPSWLGKLVKVKILEATVGTLFGELEDS